MLKLSVVTIALCYWEIMQSQGTGVIPLQYLQSLLFAISETALFCALLLVAKGWRITRTGLPASEIRTIAVALILLLSTLLFFSFYNEGYYFLSLMIMYFFMLPKIFTSITRNTRALQTQLLLMR
jgi:cation transport ATPase